MSPPQPVSTADRLPPAVAIIEDGIFDSVESFASAEEARAFARGVGACCAVHSTSCVAYVLPEGESKMRAEHRGAEVEKALVAWRDGGKQ